MNNRPPIKILLTGFGPFPGVHSNPSGEFLKQFEERFSRDTRDITLRTDVIPTSWTAAERFVSGPLVEFDPDIALHFGVHRGAAGFRIETRADNCASSHADADGKMFKNSQLVKGGPAALRAGIPAEKLVHALRGRCLPAVTSANAGRYLCNMLLYLSLNQARIDSRIRQTGFIHIPPLARVSGGRSHGKRLVFDMPTLLDGAETITERCISRHAHAIRTQRPSHYR